MEFKKGGRLGTQVKPQGELLPCPFCGGEAQIIDSKILNVSNEQLFEIGCINDPDCPCWQDTELGSLMDSGFANIEMAIANWNKRASDLSNEVGFDARVMPKPRGYYGIGIENTKTEMNIGTLWRSAKIFNASFIYTIGKRYKKQASDTLKAYRHIPYYQYDNFEQFYKMMPYDCMLIAIELDERANQINSFIHPERAIYLLGAEDNGLSREALAKCQAIVQLPGEHCLNVAVAGSIVMYDRFTKLSRLSA